MDGGPPVFPPGFTCPAVLWIPAVRFLFRLRDSHPLSSDFPLRSAIFHGTFSGPNPEEHCCPPVWPLPRSLATTCGISVDVFSSSYLDVSVQTVPYVNLWIQLTSHECWSCRFPHSEISGSKCMCHSPKLIAACHVLHRLLMPRHSPCALFCLTI